MSYEVLSRLNMSSLSSDSDMLLKKILANPRQLDVMDKAEWREPHIGDYVVIISWDTQSYVQECVRLSKYDYLEISEVMPMVVGTGKDDIPYAWAYEICVKESDSLSFLQWHYKLLDIKIL